MIIYSENSDIMESEEGITKKSLSINSLTAGYGETPILHDINLSISTGKVTALVGANGCGKSTLLKVIARILKPTAGTVQLDGDILHDLPTRRLAQQLALLPQSPIVPEGLTVHELVAQGRFPHQNLLKRWSKADSQAVAQAMYDADISEFAKRRVATLSGGQRQRCWLAMVLAQQTDMILLDEPTTFLDLKVQIDVMSLLARISRDKGCTLLVVLHELNLAAAFADDMVMMKSGSVICTGKPSDIMTPDNIRRVFDLDANIIADPLSGAPICVPRLPQHHANGEVNT